MSLVTRVLMRMAACGSIAAVAASCAGPGPDAASVTYSDAPPIGVWSFDDPAGGGGGSGGGVAGAEASGGAGGAGGVEASGGMPAEVPGPSTLRFSVMTQPIGGRYAPKNIGAVWISDVSGRHVRTLEMWASIRRRYLPEWNAATGGDRTDVVTRATLRAHEGHEVSWDLTDKTGARVAPGPLQLTLEMADDRETSRAMTVPFTLDGPLELTPPDTPWFLAMRLSVE